MFINSTTNVSHEARKIKFCIAELKHKKTSTSFSVFYISLVKPFYSHLKGNLKIELPKNAADIKGYFNFDNMVYYPK